MNILFLSQTTFDSYDDHSIYVDLMREFIAHGHSVFSVCPLKKHGKTELTESAGNKILKLYTGQVVGNTNLIKKGINAVRLGGRYKSAIKKYCKNESFDLVLYASPPITIYKAIKYAKKRFKAKTYLLLKDIFPQNAVDIGVLSKGGIKGLIYKYFRRLEKKYYAVSDKIGCMSQGNVDYLLKHEPWLDPADVEICPNSMQITGGAVAPEQRAALREKYGLPCDKRIFVYGGNLGKPQGIPFMIECLKACADISGAYFLIVGGGSEYGAISDYVSSSAQDNVKLLSSLPRDEYDAMVASCDVGLIFLDYRFTIPNYPSRLLSYLNAAMPVVACTDPNTDIGDDIVNGGMGWKTLSNDAEAFKATIADVCALDGEALSQKGRCGYEYLCDRFSAEAGYNIIIDSISKIKR